METPKSVTGKQCRHRSDATKCSIAPATTQLAIPKIEIGLFQYKVWGEYIQSKMG